MKCINKAAIYLRGNIDYTYEQYQSCNNYANNNNMKVVDVFNDKTASGIDKNRVEFIEMLEKSKSYDYILISKLHNITRSYETYQILMNTLKQNNTELIVVDENILDKKILDTVNDILNTLHSADLSKTLGDSIIENRKNLTLNHIYPGGIVPFGYVRDKNNKIHLVEEEAKVVKMIYEMYVGGLFMQEIVDYLDENNYERQKGKKFTLNSIKRTLQNEIYFGRYTYNKYAREKSDGMPKKVLKSEDEWAVSDKIFPAIISKELFDKAQIKRKRYSRRTV